MRTSYYLSPVRIYAISSSPGRGLLCSPRIDPHFSSRRPRKDLQLILGMEWYSVTELLHKSVAAFTFLNRILTFHYVQFV